MLVILFLLIFAFALLIFVVFLLAFMFTDLFRELPYVGAREKQIEEILTLAQIKKGETVVDLGSGDGRLLLESAKKGAIAIGYEINPVLILLSKIKANMAGHTANVVVKNQSLWEADLNKADVIFVYAMRKSMPKFEKFVFENAQKGTRIIANTNPFPNKEPKKTHNSIFLYVI